MSVECGVSRVCTSHSCVNAEAQIDITIAYTGVNLIRGSGFKVRDVGKVQDVRLKV